MSRYEVRKDKRRKGRVHGGNVEKVWNNGRPLRPRFAKDVLRQGSDGIRFPERSVHLGHLITQEEQEFYVFKKIRTMERHESH